LANEAKKNVLVSSGRMLSECADSPTKSGSRELPSNEEAHKAPDPIGLIMNEPKVPAGTRRERRRHLLRNHQPNGNQLSGNQMSSDQQQADLQPVAAVSTIIADAHSATTDVPASADSNSATAAVPTIPPGHVTNVIGAASVAKDDFGSSNRWNERQKRLTKAHTRALATAFGNDSNSSSDSKHESKEIKSKDPESKIDVNDSSASLDELKKMASDAQKAVHAATAIALISQSPEDFQTARRIAQESLWKNHAAQLKEKEDKTLSSKTRCHRLESVDNPPKLSFREATQAESDQLSFGQTKRPYKPKSAARAAKRLALGKRISTLPSFENLGLGGAKSVPTAPTVPAVPTVPVGTRVPTVPVGTVFIPAPSTMPKAAETKKGGATIELLPDPPKRLFYRFDYEFKHTDRVDIVKHFHMPPVLWNLAESQLRMSGEVDRCNELKLAREVKDYYCKLNQNRSIILISLTNVPASSSMFNASRGALVLQADNDTMYCMSCDKPLKIFTSEETMARCPSCIALVWCNECNEQRLTGPSCFRHLPKSDTCESVAEHFAVNVVSLVRGGEYVCNWCNRDQVKIDAHYDHDIRFNLQRFLNERMTAGLADESRRWRDDKIAIIRRQRLEKWRLERGARPVGFDMRFGVLGHCGKNDGIEILAVSGNIGHSFQPSNLTSADLRNLASELARPLSPTAATDDGVSTDPAGSVEWEVKDQEFAEEHKDWLSIKVKEYISEAKRLVPLPVEEIMEFLGPISVFFRCSQCRLVAYCSKSCIAQDWRQQHKYECEQILRMPQPIDNA
jgi:MYND finger